MAKSDHLREEPTEKPFDPQREINFSIFSKCPLISSFKNFFSASAFSSVPIGDHQIGHCVDDSIGFSLLQIITSVQVESLRY